MHSTLLQAVLCTSASLSQSYISPSAGVVDAVLIPEVPFTLKGDKGLFKYLEGVIASKGHCVVCVAEGAGQVGSHPVRYIATSTLQTTMHKHCWLTRSHVGQLLWGDPGLCPG